MTFSGVVYVAFVIDVFSRRIVGWKADTTMTTSLLEMALWARQHDGLPVAEGQPLSATKRSRPATASTTPPPLTSSPAPPRPPWKDGGPPRCGSGTARSY
jgi:transposase InsO family protein